MALSGIVPFVMPRGGFRGRFTAPPDLIRGSLGWRRLLEHGTPCASLGVTDQTGQGRDQMDAALALLLRRHRRSPPAYDIRHTTYDGRQMTAVCRLPSVICRPDGRGRDFEDPVGRDSPNDRKSKAALVLRSRAKRGVSKDAPGAPTRLRAGPSFETRSCASLLRMRSWSWRRRLLGSPWEIPMIA
jgi:hypothetical protein